MTRTTPDREYWTDVPPPTPARALGGLRRRWPTVAAIGVAGLTGYGLSGGGDLAPVLAASGLVYLGAAALQRPAAAWPVFFSTFAVITVARVADIVAEATGAALPSINPTWVLLGLAPLFVGYGVLRGAARPANGLPLQTLAMVGFGLGAALALIVGGDLGAYLVAAGLLGHAAWDVWHHRAGKVVARSLAEFCFVLDTLLAVILVIVAVRS